MNKTVVVGINSRNDLFRIWFEGADLLAKGLNPDKRYDLTLDKAEGVITGAFNDEGKRKVSGKMKAGIKIPVLDLNNRDIHAFLESIGSPNAVSITVSKDGFVIKPSKIDSDRKKRVKRFAAAATLTVGTLFTGMGVFDHAAGLTPAFQVELDQGYASVAMINNKHTPPDTFINSPIQYVNDLPECDLLIAGIPCNGASISGISKNKLDRPEQHEKVGNMAYYTLRAIEKSQPTTVLIENVKQYANTASADIIKLTLQDMGYSLSERVVNGSEVGSMEHRERWFLLATSAGDADLNDIEFVNNSPYSTIENILDFDVPDSAYRDTQPFQAKKKIDAVKGNGFSGSNEPITIADTFVKTIGAGYNKRRPSEPYLHVEGKGYRWFTPTEHARLKGVPEELIDGVAATTAHELLGQSGNYDVVKQIIENIT